MHPAPEAAVGPGYNILAANDVGEGENTIRHQLGMLDDGRCVAHHAGNEDLPRRQLDVAPYFVLVLVAHVAGFGQVRCALTLSSTSEMSRKGMSVVCGPCQLPQQM